MTSLAAKPDSGFFSGWDWLSEDQQQELNARALATFTEVSRLGDIIAAATRAGRSRNPVYCEY